MARFWFVTMSCSFHVRAYEFLLQFDRNSPPIKKMRSRLKREITNEDLFVRFGQILRFFFFSRILLFYLPEASGCSGYSLGGNRALFSPPSSYKIRGFAAAHPEHAPFHDGGKTLLKPHLLGRDGVCPTNVKNKSFWRKKLGVGEKTKKPKHNRNIPLTPGVRSEMVNHPYRIAIPPFHRY